MFLVWRGRCRVEFRDRIVELGPGELVVMPAVSSIALLPTKRRR
jgi:mannose-6-phosphate isomerase-like protein (cupin superfamily)